MANIVKDIAQLVGHTPLYEFARYGKEHGLKATVLGKLEYFNPSGSIKDRTALNMILDAEEKGLIKPGDTIVEDTSGNTGIGLAAFAANRGYKLKIFLEADQSIERRKILKAYGVDVKFTTDVPGLKEAKENGTIRFAVVTSGKSPDEENFDKIIEFISIKGSNKDILKALKDLKK